MLHIGHPGAVTRRKLWPEDVVCPLYGKEVQIWSDEPVARCRQCGFWVSQDRGASCIDWYAAAKGSIGLEEYKRRMKSRPPKTCSEENGKGG